MHAGMNSKFNLLHHVGVAARRVRAAVAATAAAHEGDDNSPSGPTGLYVHKGGLKPDSFHFHQAEG